MKIRPAIKEDALRISEILKDSFYSSFANKENEQEVREYLNSLDETEFSELISRVDMDFLVSEESDGVTGFIQLIDESPVSLPEGKHLKIDRLYLDRDAMGKGVGSALMNASMEKAIRESYKNIWLLVLRSNRKAVDFYEHFGFKTFNTSPGKFEGDRELDLWMQRPVP